MTRTFEGYNRLVTVAMVLLVAGLWYRWWSGSAMAAVTRAEVLLLGAMGIIAAIIIVWLHPQAAALQSQAFGAKDEAAKKAAFEAFFRLHMPVRSLYVVNLVLGVVLMGVKAKRLWQDERMPA